MVPFTAFAVRFGQQTSAVFIFFYCRYGEGFQSFVWHRQAVAPDISKLGAVFVKRVRQWLLL